MLNARRGGGSGMICAGVVMPRQKWQWKVSDVTLHLHILPACQPVFLRKCWGSQDTTINCRGTKVLFSTTFQLINLDRPKTKGERKDECIHHHHEHTACMDMALLWRFFLLSFFYSGGFTTIIEVLDISSLLPLATHPSPPFFFGCCYYCSFCCSGIVIPPPPQCCPCIPSRFPNDRRNVVFFGFFEYVLFGPRLDFHCSHHGWHVLFSLLQV